MIRKPAIRVLPSLLTEFPEVRSLRLEGEHFSRIGGNERHRVCYINDLPRLMPCSNPDCKGAGYHMASFLTKLTTERATFYEGEWVCDGCWNAVRFSLSLTYLDDSVERRVSGATDS